MASSDSVIFGSDSIAALVAVGGTLSGVLVTHFLESVRKRKEEEASRRATSDQMRNHAFDLLSQFRWAALTSAAKWRMIKSIQDIELIDPNESPFFSKQYFQLSSFCKFWFPDTKPHFDEYDAKIRKIRTSIEASSGDSIQSFVENLRANLDDTSLCIEALSDQVQVQLVDGRA